MHPREAEANRRDIENMRGEIVMLSKTFSDFVRRYRQVENGHSHMTFSLMEEGGLTEKTIVLH